MLALGIVVVVCAVATWASARRLTALAGGLGADLEAHLGDLRRGAARGALREVAARLPESELRGVVLGVLDAPTREPAVAALNEGVSKLSHELSVGSEVPRSAARICLATGTLVAIVLVAIRLPVDGGRAMAPAVSAFVAGVAGAIVCALVGRAAGDRARRQRDAGAELIRLLERALPGAANAREG